MSVINKASSAPLLVSFPPEVLEIILANLDLAELSKLRNVCGYFRHFVDGIVEAKAVQIFEDVPPGKLAMLRPVSDSWREAIDSKVLGDKAIAERRKRKFGELLQRLLETLYRFVLYGDVANAERALAITELDLNGYVALHFNSAS